ncbi:MAG: rhomboid family intramembrane serine protease [Pseudomonadales bacterium]
MRVIEVSLDVDLAPFSAALWQQRVAHRVYEERGVQVLDVADTRHAEAVRRAYAAWREGRVRIVAVEPQETAAAAGAASGHGMRLLSALAAYPGLTLLIGLSLLVFPFSLAITRGAPGTLVALLTIVDLSRPPAVLPDLAELLRQAQVWRWLTPIFLHFSVLHLAFNCVVVIEFGRRVERGLGTPGFVAAVVLIAVVSNLGQYALGGGPLFGGLSGVGYGLLGLVLVMSRLRAAVPLWQLPRGLAGGLLFFLVVFSTGITEPFGLHVANAAHWIGLGMGILLGLGAGLYGRARGL